MRLKIAECCRHSKFIPQLRSDESTLESAPIPVHTDVVEDANVAAISIFPKCCHPEMLMYVINGKESVLQVSSRRFPPQIACIHIRECRCKMQHPLLIKSEHDFRRITLHGVGCSRVL